ncbi:MAG: VCBS repeat-containing protein [Candidatus Sumerlaeia bacterium]|nr:VCBS repeat-containing protein [Candidatus Sumerlaeia bacterium]
MRKALFVLVIFLLASLNRPSSVSAYVERMYSLQEVLDECTNIAVGKVEKVDTERKQIIVNMERDLKGRNPYPKIQINTNTSLPQFIPYMMAKIQPGATVCAFWKREGDALACLCYTDTFWFQLYGQHLEDPGQMWWRMSHVEIRFNRTWNRGVNELINLVPEVLAGRVKAPAPNPNVPPFDVVAELAKIPGAAALASGATAARIFGRYVAMPHPTGEARGVAWADYDSDGDLDAYVCCEAGNALYQCEPAGVFMAVTDLVGLSGASVGAAWADYNADGRPDLLLSPPKLFTNLGGMFRDDTALLPLPAGGAVAACVWIDADGDGLPDILMSRGEQGLALLRNTGRDTGRFVDASAAFGLGQGGEGGVKGTCISVVDYDGDGFSDFLYCAGTGLLYRNTGNGKFEVVKDCGIRFDAEGDNGSGPAWGDYDNDGDADLAVPQIDHVKLFRNTNDGRFADATSMSGELANFPGRWSVAAWGDIDRDGRLDLYVGKADGDSRVFLNRGDGTFVNQVEALGLYHVPGNARVMGATFGDFDADGDLDILANSADGRATVFLNDWAVEDPKRVFLAVRPKGTKGIVGAVVRLFDERDKLLGLRELCAAQNTASQTDATAFFGVPSGKYKVSLCTSDGGFGEKIVEVGEQGLAVELAAEVK